ncbi:MAG: DUF1800 domain-containing protein [Chitinophagales bacterium]|nr:DUF1800 domain-containing protein [Bacteroidota bacterium]MCB9043609.1 DUF1800 domain-containing protein [Chitinophagales bacterium]
MSTSAISHQKKIQHLLWRAGFGPSPGNVGQYYALNINQAVEKLMTESTESVDINSVPPKITAKLPPKQYQETLASRKEYGLLLKDEKTKLNVAWLEQMANTPAQLREKMCFFWHDHFACNIKNPLLMQVQLNKLRKHALSYFGDMLLDIIYDPAMITYLNSNENSKKHPNENFARELLELFTIGIGNYTEHDIKEAARVFTGWDFNNKGEFALNKEEHDDGIKQFLGNSGYLTAEEILQIILAQKQTAVHLVSKISFFLCGKYLPKDIITELADYYYAQQYHTGKLLQKILTAPWFYDAAYVGTRIKSPIELLVGLMRLLKVDFHNPNTALVFQKVMGQALLQPPNVSGWGTGKDWINGFTLSYRLNIPRNLIQKDKLPYKLPKKLSTEEDEFDGDAETLSTMLDIDIENCMEFFRQMPREQAVFQMADFLYQTDLTHLQTFLQNKQNAFESQKLNRKQILVQLLSLPEYQLN